MQTVDKYYEIRPGRCIISTKYRLIVWIISVLNGEQLQMKHESEQSLFGRVLIDLKRKLY